MEEREVDFRALDYVSTYDSNLECPICRSAFVDPVVVTDCDHHFCRDCLDYTTSWNQYSGTCPTCRRPGRLNGSGSASKLLLNILDDLVVKCPNQSDGCDKQVKRGHLPDHLNIYCPCTLVECPEDGCDQRVPRKDAAQCLHQPVSCLACRQSMTVQELDVRTSSVTLPNCTDFKRNSPTGRMNAPTMIYPARPAPPRSPTATSKPILPFTVPRPTLPVPLVNSAVRSTPSENTCRVIL